MKHFVLTSVLTMACFVVAGRETPPVPTLRLGKEARPKEDDAELVILPGESKFSGKITINLHFEARTSFLWLHGHGLTVTNAHLEQRGQKIPARVVAGGEEFLGFEFDRPVSSGDARLFVTYGGSSSDTDFSGLFRRQEEGERDAATQFEATWARRVFPCFDEPNFKVPWRVAVHVRQEHTALGNAPVISETPEPGGMKCVRFAPTRPLPSYLVAVAVGPFDMVNLGTIGRKHTPVRIFVPKGRKKETAFSAQAIPQLLQRLEEYYNIAYPYEKLDHVAVPQFLGAMENAGLITYDEGLLLSPPDRETIHFKRNCANVCTHEMAHHWFGDLVTMAWWNDVWLNEAFATWISPKIVDQWQPAWRTSLDQLLATFGAAAEDSLVSARCIRQPIEKEIDIDNAFDDITYNKGAAVLNMFEFAMGQEPFRKAIQTYFRRHAYGNATAEDFLHALNQTVGRDIGSAFSTFINQAGIPLVTVKVDASSNPCPVLHFAQKRYLPIGSKGDPNHKWSIPVNPHYGSRGEAHDLALTLVKTADAVPLKGQASSPDWLLLNPNAAGYFISSYPPDVLSRLLQATNQRLSPAERMSLAQSISAAVSSAELPLGKALALASQQLGDPERRVVELAAGFMDLRDRVPQDLQANYHRFVIKAVGPLIKDLSWKPTELETEDERLRRLALLRLAADGGEDPRLIASARELTLAWLTDCQAVPPDEADAVLRVTARYADASLINRLMTEAKKTRDPTDRQRLISALGLTRDPQSALRGLEALVAREFQPVDSTLFLLGLAAHIETRALAYDYLKEHYSAILAALPGEMLFGYVPMMARGFDTPERELDVQAFFKDKDPKSTGGPRIIAQVSESIQLNYAFQAAQLPSLIEFLSDQ